MTKLSILSGDGSNDVGTITRDQYDELRALADEIHVVLPQPRGGSGTE